MMGLRDELESDVFRCAHVTAEIAKFLYGVELDPDSDGLRKIQENHGEIILDETQYKVEDLN